AQAESRRRPEPDADTIQQQITAIPGIPNQPILLIICQILSCGNCGPPSFTPRLPAGRERLLPRCGADRLRSHLGSERRYQMDGLASHDGHQYTNAWNLILWNCEDILIQYDEVRHLARFESA